MRARAGWMRVDGTGVEGEGRCRGKCPRLLIEGLDERREWLTRCGGRQERSSGSKAGAGLKIAPDKACEIESKQGHRIKCNSRTTNEHDEDEREQRKNHGHQS